MQCGAGPLNIEKTKMKKKENLKGRSILKGNILVPPVQCGAGSLNIDKTKMKKKSQGPVHIKREYSRASSAVWGGSTQNWKKKNEKENLKGRSILKGNILVPPVQCGAGPLNIEKTKMKKKISRAGPY